VSDKQRRYFNANRAKLEAQGVNVDEWNKASKGRDLPERSHRVREGFKEADRARKKKRHGPYGIAASLALALLLAATACQSGGSMQVKGPTGPELTIATGGVKGISEPCREELRKHTDALAVFIDLTIQYGSERVNATVDHYKAEHEGQLPTLEQLKQSLKERYPQVKPRPN
jgi:hypothetical protein